MRTRTPLVARALALAISQPSVVLATNQGPEQHWLTCAMRAHSELFFFKNPAFLLIQVRGVGRDRLGRLARQVEGCGQFMRACVELLELRERHIVGVSQLQCFVFGADEEPHRTVVAGAISEAGDEFFIEKAALHVHIHLEGRIADLTESQRGHNFEVLTWHVHDVPYLENIVLKQRSLLRALVNRHLVEASAHDVGQRDADKETLVVEDVRSSRGIKNLLAVAQVFQHVIVGLHERVAQQVRVDAAVDEVGGKTNADARFLDTKTEGIVEVQLHGVHITDFFREKPATEGEFFAHRPMIDGREIDWSAWESRPSGAGVAEKLVFVLEASVTWVHQNGEHLVVRVNRLFLSKGGDGDNAEYDGE